jgi:hypothetical protein
MGDSKKLSVLDGRWWEMDTSKLWNYQGDEVNMYGV